MNYVFLGRGEESSEFKIKEGGEEVSNFDANGRTTFLVSTAEMMPRVNI